MPQDAVEAGVGASDGTRVLQETRLVMQRKNQAVDLERNLVRVGIDTELAFFLGLHDGSVHRVQPGLDGTCQRVAHGSRPVVEFDRAGADLVLLDWSAVTYPYQSPDLGFVEVLVQRAKSAAVHSVMIGGEWVYRERRFTRVDRDRVLAEIAERLAQPLTAQELARKGLSRDVMPHVRRFYDGYLDGLAKDPHSRSSTRSS